MQSLQARVDLGAMAMKGTLQSQKLQHYWNLTITLFSVISRNFVGESYSSAEMQSTPVDCASRLGSKPWKQIRQVILRKYQLSLATHSPVWFFSLTTTTKASAATKLYLMFPKYCETFDSQLNQYLEVILKT